MIELKDLLEKWSGLLLGEEDKKETVRAVIGEAIGVEIKKEEVEIKNNTVYLNIRPIYKNEVFLKEHKIFSKLEEAFGKNFPKKIR